MTTAPDAPTMTEAVGVYVAAFGQPPYGEDAAAGAAFAERVGRYARDRAGFRFILARDDGGVPAGTCLAVVAHPGDWWREQAAAGLNPATTRRWLGESCLEVVHVAVAPARQRQGLGRLMLDVLVAGRPAPTGVLSCHPEAAAAQGLYLSQGWTVLTKDFSAGQLAYWLMARDL
jgi:ribosomal protein S18 acetylase RimI-like enzyme